MALNADRRFDRVLALVNKIGGTTEKYQKRIDAVEGEKFRYNVNEDPEYLQGKRERAEAAEVQANVLRGNDNEATRGYDNSWMEESEKQFRAAQQETENTIRSRMRQEKQNAFDALQQRRLQALKNRYAKVQYRNFYDLNKASEEYNFTVDRNYRKQQERLQRKNT